MPEILSKIKIEKKPLNSYRSAAEMYAAATSHVKSHRQKEFSTCLSSCLKAGSIHIDAHWFLREHLWCIYVSGFSAQTISKKYDALLRSHRIEDSRGNFIHPSATNFSLAALRTGGEIVNGYKDVFAVFKNKRKAESVQFARAAIFRDGWPHFYAQYVMDRDPAKLDNLPGIGPALACHLARNLGNLNVCKPDVHLKRLAIQYGFDTVEALCKGVSSDPIGKTDMILWFASVDNGTT